MAKHTQQAGSKRGRTLLAAAFAVAGLAITGAGVYAGLIANATGSQAVSTGDVSLTVGADGVATGFGTAVTNMAPGDTQNRFVTLTNASTISTRQLTVSVAGSANNLLVNDQNKGLQLTVLNCTVAWVNGSCADVGGPTTLLASTAVSTLSSTTSGNLVSGTVGSAYHLKLSFVLPDQTETTTNGVVPTGIQDLSNTLTVTFTEQQRAATTTNA